MLFAYFRKHLTYMRKYFHIFRSYWIEDFSFNTLLLILLSLLFVFPTLLEENILPSQSILYVMLFLFFIGIWSSVKTTWIFIASFLFGAQVILHLLVIQYPLHYSLHTIDKISSVLNTLAFIYINIQCLFRDDKYNYYRIVGAINVYLLFALLGAFLLDLIQHTFGSSIQGPVTLQGNTSDFISYIYFSLTSLTTVGFGDFLPANTATRSLSVFLSAVGMLFPAVVIARLVSANSKK